MKTVDDILNGILEVEGEAYTDDPADNGGPTKWGWTKKALRDMGWFGDVRSLDRQTAFDLYYRRFVTNSGFEPIAALSNKIMAELVDTAVNMGESWAGNFLQTSLNALNNEQKIYPDIVVDGKVGPNTIKVLKKYLDYRGDGGEVVMLRALNCLQGARYLSIAETSPKNERFVYGWLDNRVAV
jgi:lysozyme family protein